MSIPSTKIAQKILLKDASGKIEKNKKTSTNHSYEQLQFQRNMQVVFTADMPKRPRALEERHRALFLYISHV